jgi:hypothetical protein
MKKVTDVDFVEQILTETDDSSTRQRAGEVVKKLGKRIRQRHRDRDRLASGKPGGKTGFNKSGLGSKRPTGKK